MEHMKTHPVTTATNTPDNARSSSSNAPQNISADSESQEVAADPHVNRSSVSISAATFVAGSSPSSEICMDKEEEEEDDDEEERGETEGLGGEIEDDMGSSAEIVGDRNGDSGEDGCVQVVSPKHGSAVLEGLPTAHIASTDLLGSTATLIQKRDGLGEETHDIPISGGYTDVLFSGTTTRVTGAMTPTDPSGRDPKRLFKPFDVKTGQFLRNSQVGVNTNGGPSTMQSEENAGLVNVQQFKQPSVSTKALNDLNNIISKRATNVASLATTAPVLPLAPSAVTATRQADAFPSPGFPKTGTAATQALSGTDQNFAPGEDIRVTLLTSSSGKHNVNMGTMSRNRFRNMNAFYNSDISGVSPSFRLLSKMRTRSRSAPTILHSSLRKLDPHAGQYRRLVSNNQTGGVDVTSKRPLNQYGITKKKPIKGWPYLLQANSTSTLNLNSTSSTVPLRYPGNVFMPQRGITTATNNNNIGNATGRNSNLNGNGTDTYKPLNNKSEKIGTRFLSEQRLAPELNGSGRADSSSAGTSVSVGGSLGEALTFEDRIKRVRATPLPVPYPPVNLQCLREIDLQEIVKNPQLRHDIIFDPLLQFRPNLDGEHGVKKRHLSDKYWSDVENELIVYASRPDLFRYESTRLVPLFDTLRDVLLTIVPQREAQHICDILDTELNVQELVKGSLVMTNLSEWLANLFKQHCAPMRDSYVDKMSQKFREAEAEGSLSKLMEGLKLIFQILEAMKLDIANHQIRLLRPALLSNAIEFEKQYVNSLMASRRAILKPSLLWFSNKFNEYVTTKQVLVKDPQNVTVPEIYRVSIRSIISLLSCRKMVREFLTSLSFDHARLILLRADIRQLACLLVCRLLFQQLVASDTSLDKQAKMYISQTYTTKRLRDEIISIITDDHGNCRWTKNTLSISVHLCKTIEELKREYENKVNAAGEQSPTDASLPILPALDNERVKFAKAWLAKQTQPLSEVYGVLENRIFNTLEERIFTRSGCTIDGRVKQDFVYMYNSTNAAGKDLAGGKTSLQTQVSSAKTEATMANKRASDPLSFTETEEFESIYRHLYTIINLHWSVFGSHYIDALGDRVSRKGL